mmetsp:Transcript_17053/g.23866  ORF Transcript_17053/g.23866 Transcript_17053/m.23866 type:complete len:170 (+) Transcript_17053:74-583(+)|eukprot:CAMPEP_0184481438 /NCGR_PEP_ID=MMETSP0113_2-20130426/2981_1 /TAXON_ID=91329 /ORGANISM="Norrisiella sphaerica, Strain BC52" /LENGTH=169 /DNA_ID=CAMNT_0026860561 /DNA_START=9 /DNA_END=518 /DNA_ORIENTATION=-
MSRVEVTNKDEDVDYEESELTENTDVTEETDVTEVDKKSRRKMKGRGFQEQGSLDGRYGGRSGKFEGMEDAKSRNGNAKSVEGWILFVTGIHEEAQEDDVYDLFAEHGDVKQLHLNLDRRTGYVKGYALIEYEKYSEADSACKALDGAELLERKINVKFAFKTGKKSRD